MLADFLCIFWNSTFRILIFFYMQFWWASDADVTQMEKE